MALLRVVQVATVEVLHAAQVGFFAVLNVAQVAPSVALHAAVAVASHALHFYCIAAFRAVPRLPCLQVVVALQVGYAAVAMLPACAR